MDSDLTMAAHWVGPGGGVRVLSEICQSLRAQSGTKLSPVGTGTGQSTQKFPRPPLTMGLVHTAVLGDVGGIGS